MATYLSVSRSTTDCVISGVNSELATYTANSTNSCVIAEDIYQRNTGKLYFEWEIITVNGYANANQYVGVCDPAHPGSVKLGYSAGSWSFMGNSGRAYNNSSLVCYPDETVGDKLENDGVSGCVAIDIDAGKIWIGCDDAAGNFEWLACTGSGVTSDPSTNTDPLFDDSAIIGVNWAPGCSLYPNGAQVQLKLKASEFKFPIPTGFSAWEASGAATKVFTDLEQIYSLVAENIYSLLEQVYSLPFSALQKIEQVYGLRMLKVMYQYYSDAPVIKKSLLQYYQSAHATSASLQQYYDDAVGIFSTLVANYDIKLPVLCFLNGVYSIAGNELAKTFDQYYDIKITDQLSKMLDQPFTIYDGASINESLSITVYFNNVPVDVEAVSIEGGLDQYCLSCSIVLSDQASYLQFNILDEIKVVINSEEFYFFAESMERSREHGAAGYTVSGLSKTALLDEPYSDKISGEFSGMASVIISDLATGYTVNYQTVDWYIPANTLIIDDESPLEVIRKVANAAGAIIYTENDGTLTIEPRYKTRVPDWNNVTPDYYLSDMDNFFSTGENYEGRSGNNAFLITDGFEERSNITLETNDISEGEKELFVYQVPWQDNFTIEQTGGEWVVIEDIGIFQELVVEEIEFINGGGSTKKPIYSIDKSDWLQKNLGSITFDESGVLTSDVSGESLLSISYFTKYHKYMVTDNKDENVQIVARV